MKPNKPTGSAQGGKAATVSVAAARACGKLILSGGMPATAAPDPDDLADRLADGEQRPHFLLDAGRVLAAQDRLPVARPGLLDGFLASTGLDLTPFCNPTIRDL